MVCKLLILGGGAGGFACESTHREPFSHPVRPYSPLDHIAFPECYLGLSPHRDRFAINSPYPVPGYGISTFLGVV